MKREIKFRAWDGHKIVYDIELTIFQSGWSVYGVAKGDAILMQYTGLKDKNGKEIYEGDILMDGLKELMIVDWDKETASFIMVDAKDEEMGYSFECYSDLNHIEVIGNIYENHELLS